MSDVIIQDQLGRPYKPNLGGDTLHIHRLNTTRHQKSGARKLQNALAIAYKWLPSHDRKQLNQAAIESGNENLIYQHSYDHSLHMVLETAKALKEQGRELTVIISDDRPFDFYGKEYTSSQLLTFKYGIRVKLAGGAV